MVNETNKAKESKKVSDRKGLSRIPKLDIQKPAKTKKENKNTLKNVKACLNNDFQESTSKIPVKGIIISFIFHNKKNHF